MAAKRQERIVRLQLFLDYCVRVDMKQATGQKSAQLLFWNKLPDEPYLDATEWNVEYAVDNDWLSGVERSKAFGNPSALPHPPRAERGSPRHAMQTREAFGQWRYLTYPTKQPVGERDRTSADGLSGAFGEQLHRGEGLSPGRGAGTGNPEASSIRPPAGLPKSIKLPHEVDVAA
jgi:hypothetical protein